MKKEPKIIVNRIITPDGTELISNYHHDYKTYTDKSRLTFSVDGGQSYLRRGVGFSPVYNLFTDKEIKTIKEKGILYSPVSGRFVDKDYNFRDTTIDSYGYRIVSINKKSYKAHRLVFLLSGIDISDKEIDHKDNIRSNNIWTNLRIVSKEENQANSLIRKDNTTKIKGLSYHKQKEMWVGRVQHNKKRYEVSSKVKEITLEKLFNLRKKLHGHYSNNGYENKSLDTFYKEASLYTNSSFEELRKYMCRGGRGKNGDQPLKWVPLCEMSTKWLMRTITYYLSSLQDHKVTNTNELIDSLGETNKPLLNHLIESLKYDSNLPYFKGYNNNPGKTLIEKNSQIEFYLQELEYRKTRDIYIEEPKIEE